MVWFNFFKKSPKKARRSKTTLSLIQFEERVTPTVSLVGPGFRGIVATGYEPPDTVMAAGPNHIMEAVNSDIAIFDKVTGAKIYQKSLVSFFPSTYYSGGLGQFDPLLAYDDNTGRFIVGSHVTDFSAKKAYIDFAISDTSDPTKGFSETYEVQTDQGGNVWTDNGKIGFNDGAIVFSGNNYDYNQNWANQTVVIAIDKKLALDANPNTSGIFTTTRVGNFAFIPARMHGAAPTDPLLFFESNTGGGSSIQISKGTNLLSNSPVWVDTQVAVASYGFDDLMAQPGTSVTLDAGDCRTQSVDWRNNLLVGAFNSATNGDSSVAWMMFNAVPTGTPTLNQQGFIHPGPGIETAYPSVALDSFGNLGMTYLQTSKTEFMSMYVTGRSPSDPIGTMGGTFLAKAGDIALTSGNPNRAGDYSGTSIDPVDGTFWSANEYADKSLGDWGTYISHFSVSGLVTPLISASVSSNSVFLGDSVTFSVTVSKPNPGDPTPQGKVELIENNSVLASANLDANGKATFAPYAMTIEGKRQFFVKYTATGTRYKDVTSSGIVVTAGRRATELTSSVKSGDVVASSIPFGQSVTLLAYLNATVQGPTSPTGNIEFFINSKSYGTRSVSLVNNQLQAQMNVDGLTLGTYTTYANYKGDSVYGTSVSTALKFIVTKATTVTTITPQSNTAVVGEVFPIQALVSANLGAKIQGKVQFRLNGSALGSPLDVATDGTVLLRNTFLLSQIGKNRQLTATFTDTSGNYSGSTSAPSSILITNTKTLLSVPSFAKIGDLVTFTGTVSQVPLSAGTLGGFVEFFDGTKSLGTGPVDPATGIASFSSSTLDARQYQIRARYTNTTGTGVVDSGLTEPATLLISRGGPAVTFTAKPTSDTTFGDNANFSILVQPPSIGLPVPTGTVILLFGTTEIQRVSLIAGAASFALTPDQYKIGANSLTARYLGDGNYSPSDGTTANFNVVKAQTVTIMDLLDKNNNLVAGPVTFRDPVTIVVDVYNLITDPAPQGTVLLFATINGTDKSLGQVTLVPNGIGQAEATFKVDQLPVGDYQIKARYSDNDRFVGSVADPVNLSIVPGPAVVNLVGESKFRVKAQTTLTATVDDGTGYSPVGVVRFFNKDTSLLLGESTVNTDLKGSSASLVFTNAFAAGVVNIRADFVSSKPGTQNATTMGALTIFDKPANFKLTPSLTSVKVGDTVNITVNLDVPVVGDFDPAKVQIIDNGTPVTPTVTSPFAPSGNTFTGGFSLALTTVGTHSLSARYLGSMFIDAAESPKVDVLARARVVSNTQVTAFTVADAAGKAATVVLTSENLKLSATVKNTTTNLNPEGMVTFVAIKGGVEQVLGTANLKPLSSNQGVAELLLPGGITPSGTYSVVARFTSSGDFAASNSTTGSLKVVDGPASVTFVGSTTLLAGVSTILSVKVDDGTGRPAAGKVNFFNDANNNPIGSADVTAGLGALSLPNGLPAGAIKIRAEFVSASFSGANNTVKQDFVFQADSKITVTTSSTSYKTTDLITISISLEIPTSLPPGMVQILVDGQVKKTVTPTLNASTAKFEATYDVTGLSVGSHRIIAKYLGTDLTSPKESAVRTIIVRR